MSRVLLVEDDVTLAAVTSMLLRDEGFEVEVIEDARQVIARIATFRPDVLVLDLSLGGVSGIVVAAVVRKVWPSLPIIFSTGHATYPGLPEALTDPKTAMLLKPYELRSLVAAIERLVAAPEP